MRFVNRSLALTAIAIGTALGAITRTVQAGVTPLQINGVAKSLVWVKYTAENEFKKSTKLRAQGIVLNQQGVVMVTSALFPPVLPLSYIHHLKITLPFGRMKTIPAEYLGRSSDGVMCYVKALKPLHLPPLAIKHPVRLLPLSIRLRFNWGNGYIPLAGWTGHSHTSRMLESIA